MKPRTSGFALRVVRLGLCFAVLSATSGGAQCEPDGDVEFVCGPVSPEDLVAVPESPWVVVSSMIDEGHLHLADVRDHSTTLLYPTDGATSRHDRSFYGSCPGPDVRGFQPHGLHLRRGEDGLHTLYVVRHGAREAVEVFELDASGAQPRATWVGCVVAPVGVTLNSVTALPDGAFAATHFNMAVGAVWEWQPGGGWGKVPGSDMAGPNGIESSPDGRWLYIGALPAQNVVRLSRGKTPPQRDEVPVGLFVDNLRRAPDGSILAAGTSGPSITVLGTCLGGGSCDQVTNKVARVDVESMTSTEIVSYPSNEYLILATVALEVGDEVWVGGIAEGNRVARFALDR